MSLSNWCIETIVEKEEELLKLLDEMILILKSHPERKFLINAMQVKLLQLNERS